MKKTVFFTLFLSVFLLFLFGACDQNGDDDTTTTTTVSETTTSILPETTTSTTVADQDDDDDTGELYVKVEFQGEGDLIITADLYEIDDATKPMILLFHQYGSSRGEYRDIAPVLVDMEFNCLAVDTRSGGTDRWNGVENETTSRSGEIELRDYLKVYPDLVSALNYVKSQGFTGDIIVWGSSFSSTLVFKLADEYREDIDALLSFSPGEYLSDNPGIVAEWASKVDHIPCFVASGADEETDVKPIFDSIASEDKTFYLPENGNHGSSILMDDENNWGPVIVFLEVINF